MGVCYVLGVYAQQDSLGISAACFYDFVPLLDREIPGSARNARGMFIFHQNVKTKAEITFEGRGQRFGNHDGNSVFRTGKIIQCERCVSEAWISQRKRKHANCSDCAAYRKCASETLRRNGTDRLLSHGGVSPLWTRRDSVCQWRLRHKCAAYCVMRALAPQE